MSQLKGQTLPMSQLKDQTLQVLKISLGATQKIPNLDYIIHMHKYATISFLLLHLSENGLV